MHCGGAGMRRSVQSDRAGSIGDGLRDPNFDHPADLGLYFLDHIFERSLTGDVVAVRVLGTLSQWFYGTFL